MSILSPHVTKVGESLPPQVSDGLYGEVKVRIDKLLWNSPRQVHAAKAVVRAVWWGGTEHGQAFDVAHSLQKTLSTTVSYPVHTSKPAFQQYLADMCNSGGLRVTVTNGLSGALLGTARLDLTPLVHGKVVQGFHAVWAPSGEEIARIKLRVSAAVKATGRNPSGPQQAPHPRAVLPAEQPPITTPPPEAHPDPCDDSVDTDDDPPPATAPRPRPSRAREPRPAVEVTPKLSVPSEAPSLPHHTRTTPPHVVSSLPPHRSVSEQPPSPRQGSPRSATVASAAVAPTLSSMFEKAMRMRQDLSKCNSVATMDAYEASLTAQARPAATISNIALPPPVYTPFLLGDDYDSDEDDDDEYDVTGGSASETDSESSYEGHAVRILRERAPLRGGRGTAPREAPASAQPRPTGLQGDTLEDIVVTLHLGDVRLVHGGGALSLRWRVLGSRCVQLAQGTKMQLPHEGKAVPVDPATSLATVDEAVVLRMRRFNEGTSHLVVELSADDASDGTSVCLGVLDLPCSRWATSGAHHPDLLSTRSLCTEAVKNPLSNTPSCVVSYATTRRACIPADNEPAAPPPRAAPASPSPAPPSGPDDQSMKIRRVEVVHTYTAGQEARAEYDPSLSPATHTAPPRPEPTPPAAVGVTVLRGEGLPLVHVDGDGAGVPPSCAVVVNDVVATRVIAHSHDPRWDEQLRVPVPSQSVFFKLWHEGRYIAEAGAATPLGLHTQQVCVPLYPPAYARMQDGLDGPVGMLHVVIDPIAPLPTAPSRHSYMRAEPPRAQPPRAAAWDAPDVDAGLGLPALNLQLDSISSELKKRLASLDAP
eukprot:TRINITY_DN4371_c0_g1_i2.p1 TRINITY_DN4371_c0_g1~~TRINITY_DN4371_c0_g1_i2.p1  ORF type:complete len:817 (+),score=155.44 TRINITY_DN4371_c0_g1_i2:67-2517(+)